MIIKRNLKKLKSPGSGLFSHAVTSAVSSVLKRFTTVFGMGTGGTASLEPPEDISAYTVCTIYNSAARSNQPEYRIHPKLVPA